MFFDSIVDLVSGSPWAYAAILAVAALDSVLPLVPSETTVISAGVLAGAGELQLGLVIAAGGLGAYAGDSGAYWLGRASGPRLERRLFASGRAASRRDWAERTLARNAGPLVLGARFVPGGRTAVTVTAGIVRMRWARFAALAAAAGLAWASYAALIGYAGGRVFEDEPLWGLLLGFGVALGIFVAVEATRRIRRRRRVRALARVPV